MPPLIVAFDLIDTPQLRRYRDLRRATSRSFQNLLRAAAAPRTPANDPPDEFSCDGPHFADKVEPVSTAAILKNDALVVARVAVRAFFANWLGDDDDDDPKRPGGAARPLRRNRLTPDIVALTLQIGELKRATISHNMEVGAFVRSQRFGISRGGSAILPTATPGLLARRGEEFQRSILKVITMTLHLSDFAAWTALLVNARPHAPGQRIGDSNDGANISVSATATAQTRHDHDGQLNDALECEDWHDRVGDFGERVDGEARALDCKSDGSNALAKPESWHVSASADRDVQRTPSAIGEGWVVGGRLPLGINQHHAFQSTIVFNVAQPYGEPADCHDKMCADIAIGRSGADFPLEFAT